MSSHNNTPQYNNYIKHAQKFIKHNKKGAAINLYERMLFTLNLSDINTQYIEKQINTLNMYSSTENIYPSGYAVIIDTRIHEAFKLVINNIKLILPDNWSVIFMCGTNNYKWVRDTFPDIRIINTHKASISVDEYSRMLKSPHFWTTFNDVEKVLLFQLDTLVNPNSKHKLEDFLCYDYIGAPWSEKLHQIWPPLPYYGGNGGFNLSSVKMRLDIIKKYGEKSTVPVEDIFFSRELINSNYRVAPSHIAKTFSVESEFYLEPLAVHKPWEYLTAEQVSLLENNIPGLATVKTANINISININS